MNEKDLSTLTTKTRIIARAESMGIARGDRATCVLDLDHACEQFDLRLADMLAADEFNFRHDWIGIQSNMNRQTGRVDNYFVPRFAGTKATRLDQMRYIAQTLASMTNRLTGDVIEITYRRETDESVNDFTEWAQKYHGIVSGQEYFYVWRGGLLYAVNVSADSYLTAADELMGLLARKF